MSKATLVLKFEQADNPGNFWSALLRHVESTDVDEVATATHLVVFLAVKDYSLEDHQFVEVRLNPKAGQRDLVALIPRQNVVAIFQGLKTKDFGFQRASPA